MGLKEAGLRGSLRNVSVGVNTIPDSGVDNFEEVLYEDKGNSLTDYYSGETGSFSRNTTSPVFDGSYSLKVASNNVHIGSLSGNGLPGYPEKGDTFEFWVNYAGTTDTSGNITLWWGLQDTGHFPSNGYYVEFLNEYQDVKLNVLDGGSATTLDSVTGANPPTNDWVRVGVVWGSDDVHSVTIEEEDGTELASLSGESAAHGSNGVGYGMNDDNGNDLAIDEIAIL